MSELPVPASHFLPLDVTAPEGLWATVVERAPEPSHLAAALQEAYLGLNRRLDHEAAGPVWAEVHRARAAYTGSAVTRTLTLPAGLRNCLLVMAYADAPREDRKAFPGWLLAWHLQTAPDPLGLGHALHASEQLTQD